MTEELDKQNPVIDDIDTQLNKVTSQLKTNNAKLKGLITQVCAYGDTLGAALAAAPTQQTPVRPDALL
jgi:Tfp pilus assembly protein FimV